MIFGNGGWKTITGTLGNQFNSNYTAEPNKLVCGLSCIALWIPATSSSAFYRALSKFFLNRLAFAQSLQGSEGDVSCILSSFPASPVYLT